MREYYKPVYFRTEEFVDPETFAKFGEKSLMFLDIRILKIADGIRKFFGKPMMINNWHIGGPYKNRGFRKGDASVGAGYSQHKFGRGLDFTIAGMDAEEVRKIILENQNIAPFNMITRMELGITWVHIDVAHVDSIGILLFNP